MIRQIEAGALSIAYEQSGNEGDLPVILLHGFPYDVHSYDDVVPRLTARGCRVIVPYLRGYGPTRFLSPATLRSGQQAALASDLLALMDALAIPKAALAGYDWGGRAACIVAALWPERARCLVSVGSYNIQHIASAMRPQSPENELRYWYQYYFHSERGRAGLAENRRALCKLLWRLWSPTWSFDDATYDRSAAAFDNPDFVDVVIHSYRHRFGLVDGDPAVEPIEARLAQLPSIGVPTITLDGADDGVQSIGGSAHHARRFTGPHQHRVIPGVGHNPAQEDPAAFADAVIDAIAMASEVARRDQ